MQEQHNQLDSFWEVREQTLPLPTRDDGYFRVLFIGTTGAGKTTLVRQFLGAHPKEHFPSTSSGKTTTADLEVIFAPGVFQAIVTFLSLDEVSTCVQECAIAAAIAYFDSGDQKEIARKLLQHEEQRFRLKYILGDFPVKKKRAQPNDQEQESEDSATDQEKNTFALAIQRYVDTLHSLVESVRGDIESEVEQAEGNESEEDRDVRSQELLEQKLRYHAELIELVHEIVRAIKQRFDYLPTGQIVFDTTGWPLSWQFEIADRKEFIKTVNHLFSNYSGYFGKLLTPIVQGVRVRGPFRPEWRPVSAPRLVLIDGEGLGHTTATTTSIPTHVTSLFEKVDAIVLVDNATSPMQAAPLAALETIAASGYTSKLFVGFTHFESVGGGNIPDRSDREDHVRSSLGNALLGIGKRLGQRDKLVLKRSLAERFFFLSHLHELLSSISNTPDVPETLDELQRMLSAIETIPLPPSSKEVTPIYNERSLSSSIQKAVKNFRESWQRRLGLVPSIRGEHWRRVQALSDRIALRGKDEYDTLRPIADFIKEFSEQIKIFLEKPLRWEPSHGGTEEMRQVVIDSIARELYTQLHILSRKRIITDHLSDWVVAHAYSGTGSTKLRARDIDGIYRAVAPTRIEIVQALEQKEELSSVSLTKEELMSLDRTSEITLHIIMIVKDAVQACGGKLTRL